MCALVAATTVEVSPEVGNAAVVGESGGLKDEGIGESSAVVGAGDVWNRVKEAVEEHVWVVAWRSERDSFLGRRSSARTAGRVLNGSPSEWDYCQMGRDWWT